MSEEIPAPAEPTPITEAPVEAPVEAPAEVETAPTAREALERAFEKVDAETDGQSNEAAPITDGQPRGPDGKFVSKDGAEPAKEAEAPKAEEKPAEEAPAKFGDAPARFSADAKAAWKDAPGPVKAEIHRAVTELEAGLAKKDEVLKPLQPFMDMAAQHNTTVHHALQSYTAIDAMLNKDPARGLALIAERVGLTTAQAAELLSGKPAGDADPRDQKIMQLERQLAEVRGGLGQVNTTMQQQNEQAMEAQVLEFAKTAPRFDELSGEIVKLLETGYAKTLEEAYQFAERINPAPAPEPAPAPPPPAQTQGKSVTGAPSSGSNPATLPKSKTTRNALENAFARAGLT